MSDCIEWGTLDVYKQRFHHEIHADAFATFKGGELLIDVGEFKGDDVALIKRKGGGKLYFLADAGKVFFTMAKIWFDDETRRMLMEYWQEEPDEEEIEKCDKSWHVEFKSAYVSPVIQKAESDDESTDEETEDEQPARVRKSPPEEAVDDTKKKQKK